MSEGSLYSPARKKDSVEACEGGSERTGDTYARLPAHDDTDSREQYLVYTGLVFMII